MRLLIDIDGDQQLHRQLLRWTDRLTDASPAFDRMASTVATIEQQQFSSQGGYGSGGWSPLSPRYRAWKMRHYPGKPILERTGALKRSLTDRPFGIEQINETEMTIGTEVPYARYHQRGTDRMPRRRPLELPASGRTQLVKILQRFIQEGDA
ncbi:phage virion morphogenesis protein [Nakamurella lactea]|uniref:phage virion morphogenesis protein n=1 Tax=Nakamurella lactea TaxID=459515 RepID=UPI000411DD25|nr:phage virion morphogenesis protein [Nakamurella lactea]